MVEDREEPPKPTRRRPPSPEEVWIRGFLEFSGTDNTTRFCRADLKGVSLTKALETIFLGEMTRSEKCEGPGALCRFEYECEEGLIVVDVFFVANEMKLEIRGAVIVEVQSEPDAA